MFFLIFATVFGCLVLWSWLRQWRFLPAGPWRKLAGLAHILTVLGALSYFVLRSRWPLFMAEHPWLLLITALCIGLGFMLFATALALDLFGLVMRLVPLKTLAHWRHAAGRTRLGALVLACYLGVGLWGAAGVPPVVPVEVRMPGLHGSLRLVHLTDLHLDPALSPDAVREVVQRTNAQKPDLILLTGDIVDFAPHLIRPQLAALADLQAPGGIWFVAGNHEYYRGIEASNRALQELGFNELCCRIDQIEIRDQVVGLMGLADPTAARMGDGRILPDALVQPADSTLDPHLPLIVLSHQPRQIEHLDGLNNPTLVLSGHTHGGQIFPFGLLVSLVQPLVAGLEQYDRLQLYVSRGTGTWGPRLRVLAPHEITRIDLVPATAID